MPKVSVIMPVYNAEKYLREAIDSILEQSFTDFEFIIIDDASKDSSVDIVKEYNDSRIQLYQNDCNMGVAATLNRGLYLAKGEYIARMDADDISLSERFEMQVKELDNDPMLGLCGSNVIVFSDTKQHYSELPLSHLDIQYTLFILSSFVHPVVMLRKSMLTELNLYYEETYEGREDYRLWMQVGLSGWEMKNLEKPLLKYRVHSSQVTKKHDDRQTEKHCELKRWYLKKNNIEFSDKELEVLCKVSLGGVLESYLEIKELKVVFEKIIKKYDSKYFPKVFQDILNKNIRKNRIGFFKTWILLNKFQLMKRVIAIIRGVKK